MKNKKTTIKPDLYELELIEGLNKNEWISTLKLEEEKVRYQNIAISSFQEAIQIKIVKEDIDAIKKQSKELGIPYHTLISSLIHNFANGKIKLKFE